LQINLADHRYRSTGHGQPNVSAIVGINSTITTGMPEEAGRAFAHRYRRPSLPFAEVSSDGSSIAADCGHHETLNADMHHGTS
jgi:TPP-dependent pyruvate/acetoin dehydrogenase alpha subunit